MDARREGEGDARADLPSFVRSFVLGFSLIQKHRILSLADELAEALEIEMDKLVKMKVRESKNPQYDREAEIKVSSIPSFLFASFVFVVDALRFVLLSDGKPSRSSRFPRTSPLSAHSHLRSPSSSSSPTLSVPQMALSNRPDANTHLAASNFLRQSTIQPQTDRELWDEIFAQDPLPESDEEEDWVEPDYGSEGSDFSTDDRSESSFSGREDGHKASRRRPSSSSTSRLTPLQPPAVVRDPPPRPWSDPRFFIDEDEIDYSSSHGWQEMLRLPSIPRFIDVQANDDARVTLPDRRVSLSSFSLLDPPRTDSRPALLLPLSEVHPRNRRR